MTRAAFLLSLSLLAAPALADSPIRLPELVQPSPAPSPAPPTPVTLLPPDVLYVIDADVECIVLASPGGLVSIGIETGPVKMRAKFADAPDRFETRTFKGKQVTSIEARGTGTVELLIVPIGATSSDQVLRRTLSVKGLGPQPPPGPGPGPGPTPPAPDGPLGLTKASRDGAAQVVMAPDVKAIQAQKLAKANRAHAAAVAAGAFATPAAILTGWRAANNGAVNSADWQAWAANVSPALSALYTAGKLPANTAWAAAFNEIADGLGGN